MIINTYQQKVLNDLSSYLGYINTYNNLYDGWKQYWAEQDIRIGIGGVPEYDNTIAGVPHVCMKVPTGGGKTLLGCASLKRIFDFMPLDRARFVLWLVPTDQILKQTVKALKDVNNDYRQQIDRDFSGKVQVFTKEQLLNAESFSPDSVIENLTICIMSFNSLRINRTLRDVRKVYQQNGNLFRFSSYFNDPNVLLEDTPDSALIQIIRQLTPVVIVDESHNVTSDLSIEMLSNINPSFILDLTATPRVGSNIISYVDAKQLKSENMVKLPVVVYNRDTRKDVILDAIQLRSQLEQQANLARSISGKYIRPIVLFQAQPNIDDETSETYTKIKDTLIKIGIPDDEIAIKTGNVDDLKDVELLSERCKIRYIITVNALKEGWDCPFAYVLASLANKTSSVDVEQIVGRILRQPYAKQHPVKLLNCSYVLTCSSDFYNTLSSIVKGLNNAGFSKKDFRVGNEEIVEENSSSTEQQLNLFDYAETVSPNNDACAGEMPEECSDTPEEGYNEVASDSEALEKELAQTFGEKFDSNSINEHFSVASSNVSTMLSQAETQTQEYENSVSDDNTSGGDMGELLHQIVISEKYKALADSIQLPQFVIETEPDLFGSGIDLLEKETLSKGFSLSGQDATVSFELSTGEMYNIDVEDNDSVPKYKRMSRAQSERIREYLVRLPEAQRKETCVQNIISIINKNNRFSVTEITDYVNRVVANMTDEEIASIETSYVNYAQKIEEKIKKLEDVYREKLFFRLIDEGKIKCMSMYSFPQVITPTDTLDSVPDSLYTEEKNDMNTTERRVLDTIIASGCVEFWHRIIERKGFRINGFINHYPDFYVRTRKGNNVLVEVKGDDRDNSDSSKKLKLGRQWQAVSGNDYRYFMVYEKMELGEPGAYTLDSFAAIIKEL